MLENLQTLAVGEGRDMDFSDLGISVQPVIRYRLGQIVVSASNRCEVVDHNGAMHLKRLWTKPAAKD